MKIKGMCPKCGTIGRLFISEDIANVFNHVTCFDCSSSFDKSEVIDED